MRISNSKKQLAKIIHENGGWREGAKFAAQGGNQGHVGFASVAPVRHGKVWDMARGFAGKFLADEILPNWHQTILSRDEYFRLYPAQDADGWIEWKGGDCPVRFGELIDVRYRDGHVQLGCRAESRCDTELYATTHWGNSGGAADIIAYRLHKPEQDKSTAVGGDETGIEANEGPEAMNYKPTIEQLAADYRNAKNYAERKQQEADAAKADADAKLAELVAAGKAHGLVLSVADTRLEPVINDWRDLRVGDEVECISPNVSPNKYRGRIGRLIGIDEHDSGTPYLVDFGECAKIWCHEVKFIRRPAKGDANA